MPQYAYFKPFENWESQFPNGTLQLFEDKVHVLEEEKKRRKMLLPDDKKNLNTTIKPNQGVPWVPCRRRSHLNDELFAASGSIEVGRRTLV